MTVLYVYVYIHKGLSLLLSVTESGYSSQLERYSKHGKPFQDKAESSRGQSLYLTESASR